MEKLTFLITIDARLQPFPELCAVFSCTNRTEMLYFLNLELQCIDFLDKGFVMTFFQRTFVREVGQEVW